MWRFPKDLWAHWRQRGWVEVDAAVYAEACSRYGNSVITHPFIIQQVTEQAGIGVRYLAHYSPQGELLAAIPVWGKFIAGSKLALKYFRRQDQVDMGDPEIILPLQPGCVFDLRYRARFVSAKHVPQLPRLQQQTETLSLAKDIHGIDMQGDAFSRKTRYNLRRELRLFEDAGGELVDISAFPPADIAAIYIELFERRWGFKPRACAQLSEQLRRLYPFMIGKLACIRQRPVAVQLLFMAESPQWISVEYVNGGYDPACKGFSPGSLLSFANTRWAGEHSAAAGKELRYSFGKSGDRYKDTWCNRCAVYGC